MKTTKKYEFSFDIEYNFDSEQSELVIWKGNDFSRGARGKKNIEFSAERSNFVDLSIFQSERSSKNFAVVAGDKWDFERVFVNVDLRRPEEDKRELWVNAKDISSDSALTPEACESMLFDRGVDELLKRRPVCRFSAEYDDPFFRYPDDFDLGDIVTISDKSRGISSDSRITEIDETIKGGVRQVNLKFSNGTTLINRKD